MEKLGSHWKYFNKILYISVLGESAKKIPVS
jgi:hypothetical protein